MEVGYHKIRIVQVHIERRVTKEDTCKTTGNEHGHETKSEQHRRRKTYFTAPDGCEPVEHFYSRWYSDKQGKQYEYRTEEGAHTCYEHMVRPNEEGQYG